MGHPFGNDKFPDGSARLATEAEIEAAGLFDFAPDAVYCGKAYGRRLWHRGAAGIVLVAGARTGKLTTILVQNICHSVLSVETLVIVDVKGELAAISRDQTPDEKFCIYWNPVGMFDLPQHRINPVGHLRWSSPTLVSDTKLYFAGLLPETGAGAAKYFELNARRVGEGIALSLTEALGALTLPEIYSAVLGLQAGGRMWLPYGNEMKSSSLPEVRALAAEIENAQADSSGGWRGIVGELMAAFACLSDPVLRSSLSPPFDFRLEELTASDRRYQFYLMCPERMVAEWAPVVKSFLTTTLTLKARAPEAPRQTWVIDEAARFHGYGEIADLYTIGAGLGVRPLTVFQDFSQMNDLAPNAQRKILSSAGVQIVFGAREQESARHISEMLGAETLLYDDKLQQGRARVDLRRVIGSVLDGQDVIETLFELRQKRYETVHRTRQRRMQQTPDEVRRMPADALYVVTDGLHPIRGERVPYWEQAWMAYRYHPNPYHPPGDRVRIQTRLGPRYRPVLTRKVPERFAGYPQYAGGMWSYVKKVWLW